MTSPSLKDLRNLRVLVCHPDDQDGQQLLRHLNRIGCIVETVWPPPTQEVPSRFDVVLLAVTQELSARLRKLWNKSEGETAPSLIALVDYENPTTLQAVLEIGPHAVLGKPIRPFGLLTNLVVARQAKARDDRLRGRIRKLEQKLTALRTVDQAKTILMAQKALTEGEAYELIRKQAMSKRLSIEEIARSVINAEELLRISRDSA